MTGFDLTGRVAIITGSGRGLGKAMAQGLMEAGAKLTVCARTAEQVQATAAAFRAAGGDVLEVVFDATRRGDCQRLVAETVAHYGRLDVMLANHGGGANQTAIDTDDATWRRVIDQNLNSAFMVCQEAARQMIRQGTGGSIIVTSSTSSIRSFAGLMAYGAAKGGVDQMVRQMADEWGPHGIRVNALNPGYTTHRRRGYDPQSEGVRAENRHTPLGRSGRPEEFAGPAVFLASDASSYITGHSLIIDGGYAVR